MEARSSNVTIKTEKDMTRSRSRGRTARGWTGHRPVEVGQNENVTVKAQKFTLEAGPSSAQVRAGHDQADEAGLDRDQGAMVTSVRPRHDQGRRRWRSTDERREHRRHRARVPTPRRPSGRGGARQRLDDINEAITLILSTARASGRCGPQFGCGIHDYVFESIDAYTVGRLEREVRIALDRWEPRIEVIAHRSRPTGAGGGEFRSRSRTSCAPPTTAAISSTPST